MGKTDIFIGIDIGSSSIKLAELKKIRDAFYVEKALISEFELDESTLKAVQSQDAVREIVKAQLKNIPKKTKKVCISVWG